jgi:acetyltransferase
MTDPRIAMMLNPRGVVVVGASQEPGKLGYGLARNLVQGGYSGVVHLVNPRGGTLFDRPVYTQLAEVPDPVDLAVLLIPAGATPDTLAACGKRGIRSAIIASGGFREIGPAGAALEIQCQEIAHLYGMRLLGPNCVGLINSHLPLNATFLAPPGPIPGELSFLSHSGAICQAVIDWANAQELGFSQIISLGNEADLTETDFLEPVAHDTHTRVLTFYLEGINQGRRFIEESQKVARNKPLVALKVGRFASGRRAAQSHTGALAGEDHVVSAAFRRAGVLRANTAEELFDWAQALAWCPPLRGRSIAILTNAGGPGVTAADALEAKDLRLAELQPSTIQALRAGLPAAASPNNPVDILASASPQVYANCLKILLEDPGVHGVMIILPPPPVSSASDIISSLIPLIHQTIKPVVFALMGGFQIQSAIKLLRAARIPEYRFPERAAGALAALAERQELLSHLASEPVRFSNVDLIQARQLLQAPNSTFKSLSLLPETWLPQETVARLFKLYSIPIASLELAASAEEAVEIGRSFGLGRGRTRLALKIAAADLAHKSDVGGVLLDLADEQAVANGYRQMIERVKAANPQSTIAGAYVQVMAPPGQDVIVGAVQDPQFGPLVMFGSGGVEVEGLGDVYFALAPLTRSEAEAMLDQTWAGRKLRGFRNLPPADREAVIETLIRLAQMASDLPELAEVEINPLRVLPPGKGVLALDVRCRL